MRTSEIRYGKSSVVIRNRCEANGLREQEVVRKEKGWIQIESSLGRTDILVCPSKLRTGRNACPTF
jgi:hypothetical protein